MRSQIIPEEVAGLIWRSTYLPRDGTVAAPHLSINDLGDGVLSEIFSHLNAAQVQVRVCHRWRAITLRMTSADKWYHHWDDKYTDIIWPAAQVSTDELVAAALDPRTQSAALRKMMEDRTGVGRRCKLALNLRACIRAGISMERLIYVLDGLCRRTSEDYSMQPRVCADSYLYTNGWQERDKVIARYRAGDTLTAAEFLDIVAHCASSTRQDEVRQFAVDMIARASPVAQQVAAVFLVSFYVINQCSPDTLFELHPTLAEHHGWCGLYYAGTFIYNFRRSLLPNYPNPNNNRIDLVRRHYAAVDDARRKK